MFLHRLFEQASGTREIGSKIDQQAAEVAQHSEVQPTRSGHTNSPLDVANGSVGKPSLHLVPHVGVERFKSNLGQLISCDIVVVPQLVVVVVVVIDLDGPVLPDELHYVLSIGRHRRLRILDAQPRQRTENMLKSVMPERFTKVDAFAVGYEYCQLLLLANRHAKLKDAPNSGEVLGSVPRGHEREDLANSTNVLAKDVAPFVEVHHFALRHSLADSVLVDAHATHPHVGPRLLQLAVASPIRQSFRYVYRTVTPSVREHKRPTSNVVLPPHGVDIRRAQPPVSRTQEFGTPPPQDWLLERIDFAGGC
mmetsp:Transcript_14893/g.41014  ORF Transcript_14893/g.41014 Transcript_14893/m.41014 type:complete len:308 (+) Transcript_14893:1063-1986(+)